MIIEENVLGVLDCNDIPVGAAFLVASDLAVTCTHVIEDTGCEKSVKLRTPTGGEIVAEIVPDWMGDSSQEDISVLRLVDNREDIAVFQLLEIENATGHTFLSYGFTDEGSERPGRGVIIGWAKEKGIKILTLESSLVTKGFSGAPVYDEEFGCVVGVIFSISSKDENDRQGYSAYAIPARLIGQICKKVSLLAFVPEEIPVPKSISILSSWEHLFLVNILDSYFFTTQDIEEFASQYIQFDARKYGTRKKDYISSLVEHVREQNEIIQLIDNMINEKRRKLDSEFLEFWFYYEFIRPFQISFGELYILYQRCLSPHQEVMLEKPKEIFGLLNNLFELHPNKAGIQPVLHLAGLLNVHEECTTKVDESRMKIWMRSVVNYFDLSDNAVAQHIELGKSAKGIVKHCHSLVILIIPISPQKDIFDIRFGYFEGGNYTSIGIESDKKYEALPGILSDVLNHLKDRGYSLEKTRIEFVLPNNLWTLPVEQIELPVDEPWVPEKIFKNYSVVIRPYMRYEKRGMYESCIKRWRSIQSDHYSQKLHEVTAFTDGNISARDIVNYYEGADNRNIVCVGISCLPEKVQDQISVLGAVLSSGMPIVVWLRKEFADYDLNELLTRKHILELPISVYEDRCEAGCVEEHAGKYLSIIWDDPFSIPPKWNLGAS